MSATTFDDAAFDRSLARQYSNSTWAQLGFVYFVAPIFTVVFAFMPMGTLFLWITALLVVAAGLASMMRTVMMPRALRRQANLVELFVQFGAGAMPVLSIGLPLALYAAWLLLSGAMVAAGVL